MIHKAALVTGASSGIGFEIARVLGEEGYAVTAIARRREKLDRAVDELRAMGGEVQACVANVANDDEIAAAVNAHSARYGRLDVLVNNAGIGIAGSVEGLDTKYVEIQTRVNLSSVFAFYRLCLPLLRGAAAEHRNALVVNTSSISGKIATPMLGVYSAVKHAVVGYTYAMNRELGPLGIKSCVLCPSLVDTQLAAYFENEVPRPEMIRPADVAEGVRMLLRLSAWCVIPEIQFMRPGLVP